MWEGFETRRDAAAVQALRAAGAIILGKTTTTEFAATEPLMPVRNPHDRSRTAGGSSSGSAAAVGAGILPAALGTQVVGSTLRPASYCGCVGFKPTFGALNRSGSFDHLSQSCLGILAATPEDAWLVASAIVTRVGGDPGHEGLNGPTAAPAAIRPSSLAVLETAGWAKASSGARAAFAGACQRLTKLGIGLADRHSDPAVEAFEATISEANAVTFRIFDWEFRWPLTGYAARNGLSAGMRRRVESAQQLTLDDYRDALRRRQEIRAEYAKLGLRYDGIVTLAATGAAPIGLSWTGDPTINIPASLLGVPAISLPFLSDENMPLGLQLIGRAQEDAHLLAVAQWLWRNYPTSE
jgi:Asp-tRNA(Asn)/Glu-tRNA(Gln) amidotransferase A subunit family amidase